MAERCKDMKIFAQEFLYHYWRIDGVSGPHESTHASTIETFRTKTKKTSKKKFNKPKTHPSARNVHGHPLELCSDDPVTGYNRQGYCTLDENDRGTHTVCAKMTDDFLKYTKSRGNDLSTPNTMYGFPGLKPGDRWCLCHSRYEEAKKAGKAPHKIKNATLQGYG